MADDVESNLARIRAALGRTAPLVDPPIPPAIDEPITRLVHFDIGLAELFAKTAQSANMQVNLCRPEDVATELAAFFRENGVRRLAIAESPLLERLGIVGGLKDRGFEVKRWSEMTLDELYDFDCGITDVYRAVAETGSLVIRPSAGHGRALSLIPPIHVAVVEPKNLVADLVDLFEILLHEPDAGRTAHLITGPSKTADIEMNLVVGVHGPGQVHIVLLN